MDPQADLLDSLVGPEPTPEEEPAPDLDAEMADEEPSEPQESEPSEPPEPPESEPEPAPLSSENKVPDGYVPLHELLRERDKKKEAEYGRDSLKDALDSLRSQIEEMRAPKVEEQIPDPDEDPAGYLKHQNEQLTKKINDLESTITHDKEESRKTTEAERQGREQQSRITTLEGEFKKQSPDYNQALQHMRLQQFNHLVTNQGMTQQEAMSQIFRGEFQEAVQLMNAGYNPAEMLYLKAQRNFGYKRPDPAVTPAEDPAQKESLQNLDKALNAATGSGNKGGKPSLEDLVNMDDDTFKSVFDELYEQAGYKKY